MATTVSVTHACGHRGETKVFGNSKSKRSGWLARVESGLCLDCRKTDGQNKAAEFAASHPELPALWGSPAQVPWGHAIRADKLELIESQLVLIESQTDIEYYAQAITALEWLYQRQSAGWWISRRRATWNELIDAGIQAQQTEGAA